jgi:hypothetical protein
VYGAEAPPVAGSVIRVWSSRCRRSGDGVIIPSQDWLVQRSFPGEPGIVDVPLATGPCQACVSDFASASLNELAGTDLEAAIDAACQQGVLGDQQPPVCT